MDNKKAIKAIEDYIEIVTYFNQTKTGADKKDELKAELRKALSALSIADLRMLHNQYIHTNGLKLNQLLENLSQQEKDDVAIKLGISNCRASMDVVKMLKDARYYSGNMSKILSDFVSLDDPLLMLDEYCEFVSMNNYSGKSTWELEKAGAIAENMWKALNIKLMSMSREKKQNAIDQMLEVRDVCEKMGQDYYAKAQSLKVPSETKLTMSDKITVDGLVSFQKRHNACMFEKYQHPHWGMVNFIDSINPIVSDCNEIQ